VTVKFLAASGKLTIKHISLLLEVLKLKFCNKEVYAIILYIIHNLESTLISPFLDKLKSKTTEEREANKGQVCAL
jgi:hypothetical protein